MRLSRIVIGISLAGLTVAAFPLSLLGWLGYGIWWYATRRQQATAVANSHPARIDRYEAALAALEQRVRDTVAETELLAKIKYAEWLIDKERRKQYWLTHGVVLPETPRQRELDRFFAALEERLEAERVAFHRESARIAQDERRQLEYQRQRADAATREHTAELARAQAQEAEQARIMAEQAAAERIARALAGDLA